MTARSIKGIAHRQARHALLNGRIVAQPCERCGVDERLHMHHEDYSKPLDIRWLCDSCHIQYHWYLQRTGESLDVWIAQAPRISPKATNPTRRKRGRPSKNAEESMTPLPFRIPLSMKVELNRLAELFGETVSSIIQRAVKDEIRRMQKLEKERSISIAYRKEQQTS